MSNCLFCKIVKGELNTKFVYEDDLVVVFPDIRPKADTHLLITAKEHLVSLAEASEKNAKLLSHMLLVAPKLAKDMGIKGFRTIINTGREGGQEIDHIHSHLLAGKNLPGF